jgi:oxygen-independent coproporphyrinogen-3 oxidase
MFDVAKEFLLSEGYRQRTVYDWEKVDTLDPTNNISEKYLYENNLRDFLATDNVQQTSCMGGLGFAAVNMRMQPLHSKTPSISSMNHKSLAKYYDDVLAGILPVERAFIHENEDVKLVWIFQALQEMKICTVKYEKIFNRSIIDDFKEIWIALEKEAWIELAADEIILVGEGQFYVPLIQSLISKSQVDIISKKQAKQKEPA